MSTITKSLENIAIKLGATEEEIKNSKTRVSSIELIAKYLGATKEEIENSITTSDGFDLIAKYIQKVKYYGSIEFVGGDTQGELGGEYIGLTRDQLMNVYPFNQLRVVKIQPYNSNGVALKGLDSYVEIPNFYYRQICLEDGTQKIEIANYKINDTYQLVYNDESVKNLYLGVYKASFKDNFMREIVGEYPKISYNQANAINAMPYYKNDKNELIRAEYQDYRIRGAYTMLATIWLKDRNSQNTYRGMVDYSWGDGVLANQVGEIGKSGTTDEIEGLSGEIVSFGGNSIANGRRPFKLLGVENPYGLVYENVYGIYHKDGLVYTYNGKEPLSASEINPSDANTKLSATTIKMAQANGYFKGFEEVSGLVCPTSSIGGSASIGYGDYYYYATGWKIFLVGGSWYNSSSVGMVFAHCNSGFGSANSYIGFRLSFVK